MFSLLTDGKLVYLPSSSNLFPKTSQVTLPGATGGICLIPLRDIQEGIKVYLSIYNFLIIPENRNLDPLRILYDYLYPSHPSPKVT